MDDLGCHVEYAVRKCPFLRQLADTHGESYAVSIAINPTRPAPSFGNRPILEEATDFAATFRLFHGTNGVLPLKSCIMPERTVHTVSAQSVVPSVPHANVLQGVGLASLSLNMGGEGPFGFFKKNRSNRQQEEEQQRKERLRKKRPQRPKSHFPGNNATGIGSQAAGSAPGTCPLRKWLGPAAPLLFQEQKVHCPEFIVKMRAALAQTQVVRELRPQALPAKLLAVGGASALVNVPFGAFREHTEKFSLGWFIAVHASIPFIAMLRKAVIMPKYAIVFTIATAIAGQAIGAKLERERISQTEAQAAPVMVQTRQPLICAPQHRVSWIKPDAIAGMSMDDEPLLSMGFASIVTQFDPRVICT